MSKTLEIVSSFDGWLIKAIRAALDNAFIPYDLQQSTHLWLVFVESDRVLEARQICWDIEIDLVEKRRKAFNDAYSLSNLIKVKSPSYWVRYNPEIYLMDEEIPGAFEIGTGKNNVHYRRKTASEVEKLITG